MARRKKSKKQKTAAQPAAEQSFSNNPLAALAALRTERDGKAPKKRAPKVAPVPPAPTAQERAAAPRDEVDDETLFREAVEGIAPGALYNGKFGGGSADERLGTGESTAGKSGAEEDKRPTLTQDERSQMEFEQAMMAMGLEPPPQARTAQRVVAPPQETAAAAAAAVAPARPKREAPAVPRGQESVRLNGGERRLVEQVRRAERAGHEVPTISLRGEGLRTALAKVDAFLDEQSRAGARYARIITGKGKKSPQEPVIKREVAGALEAHRAVALAAPEVGRDGDFGAYLVHIRRVR